MFCFLLSCQLPPEIRAWISKIPLPWLPASLCLIWRLSEKIPGPLVEHNTLVLSQGTEPSHISVSAAEPSSEQGPSFLPKKLLLDSFKCLLLRLNWSRKCFLKLGFTQKGDSLSTPDIFKRHIIFAPRYTHKNTHTLMHTCQETKSSQENHAPENFLFLGKCASVYVCFCECIWGQR